MSNDYVKSGLRYSSISLQMAAIIILFHWGGSKLHTLFALDWIEPAATMAGIVLAVARMIIQAIKESRK